MYDLFYGINIGHIENVTINNAAPQSSSKTEEKKEEKPVTDVEKKCDRSHEYVDFNEVDEEDVELPKEDMDILIMCFKGNKEKALKFLAKIRGMNDYEKAALVNSLVRSGDLSKEYKHRKLWSLLHRNGLYSKSESNWNKIIE